MKSKDFSQIPLDTDIILYCDDFIGDYSVEGQIKMKTNLKGKPKSNIANSNSNSVWLWSRR